MRLALRLPSLMAAGTSWLRKLSSAIYIVFRVPFKFHQAFMRCLQMYHDLDNGLENSTIIVNVLLVSSWDVT